MPTPNLNASFSSFKASLPSTGFDLSRDFKFTCAPNMYLPVWQHICNPREKFNINLSANVQCQPIVRPCEMTVDQKVDFFFVPMQMMFTAFGNVLYETNDYLTTAADFEDYTNANPEQFPLVNISSVCGVLQSYSSDANRRGHLFMDEFGSYNLNTAFFDSQAKGMFRLLMHLGYNPFAIYSNWNASDYASSFGRYQPNVFPVFAAAYQAVYQNYYRNDDRERRNLHSYQLDYVFSTGTANPSIFDLRYCQRPRDYFTSLRVSPIMSVLNQRGSSEDGFANKYDYLTAVNNYLYGFDDAPIEQRDYTGIALSPASSDGQDGPSDLDSSMSDYINKNKYFANIGVQSFNFSNVTNQLRTMFAVERLLRISGRASKNYDSQVLAHLGVKVPHDIKHEISHIGTFYGSFDVQKVVSTANTAYEDGSDPDLTNLGELAGNGIGSIKGKNLYFDAPCHGVIIGIYSAVPRVSYPLGTMIDKQNMLVRRTDLFTAEFDKLGDQPLFVYEQHTFDTTSSGTVSQPANTMFLGWQRRYEQYKRKYDVHSLAFAQPYSYAIGTDAVIENAVVNTWSPWVIGRYPFRHFFVSKEDGPDEDAKIIDITPRGSDFLGSPTDLDDIFVQKYMTEMVQESQVGKSPWLHFQTDPFMVALKCNVKMVSRMSTTGEPSLNGLGI